jgi:hypothetical protein
VSVLLTELKLLVMYTVCSLGQARKLCPNVHTIPYEFERSVHFMFYYRDMMSFLIINRYKRFSLQFYTILMKYADDLQAVSVDEALIDVTSTVENARLAASTESASQPPADVAKELAEAIRTKIRVATGCEGESAAAPSGNENLGYSPSEHRYLSQCLVSTCRHSTC